MAEPRDLAYYKRLPYTRRVEIRHDGEAGGVYFLARIEEIPFIRSEGDTREEALFNLAQLFEDCIESMIATGDAIPEPGSVFPLGPVTVQEQLPVHPQVHGTYRTAPNASYSDQPSSLKLVGA